MTVAEETVSAPPAHQQPRVRGAVAIIVTRFPRIHETYVVREINELERQGQPVVLVPLHRGRGRVIHEEAKPWLRRAVYTPLVSLHIIRANLRRMFRRPRRYFSLLGRLIAGTAMSPSVLVRTMVLFPKSVYLGEVLRTRGVRHVHAEFATDPATAAYIMSVTAGISYSFTVHGPDVFVHRLLMREKIAYADFVRSVSTFAKAFLTGLYPVVTESKMEVVRVGVDPEVYEEAAAASTHEVEQPRIFSAARLTDTKAYPVLIDACARLKRAGIEFECVIAGEGPQVESIEEAIRLHDVADRVRLLGPVPQHEVTQLVGDADIFVLPSVIAYSGQMDGIPVALMEAMAAGRPVIASAVSAIPELVENGRSGLLVDVTHPEQLASAIQRLISDPALRERMGRVGQQKVRSDFDVKQTSAQVIALFDRHHRMRPTAAKEIEALNWDDLNVCALGVRRMQRRRESFIAEVTITDGIRSRDVIVKQHYAAEGEVRSPGQMARDEHDTLADLHARLATIAPELTGNIVYTVPQPVLLDEARGAVIMERAPGQPLEALIRNARNRGLAQSGLAHSRLALPLRRAATWLRLMQSVTKSSDDGRHIITAAVVVALRDLDLACAGDATIARWRDRIASTLRSLEASVASRPAPEVGHHGDFWSGNVFVGDRRIDVIDFEGFREGLPLEDVAYFLVHLEQYFAYPFLGRVVPHLAKTFVESYANGQPIDEEMLRLLTIAKALQLLARGGGAERGRLRDLWRRRALRAVVRRGFA